MIKKRSTSAYALDTAGATHCRTPKQVMERLILVKLDALRRLSRHLGLMPHSPGGVSVEERAHRLERHGLPLLVLALAIMGSSKASGTQRTAASMIVEFYIPSWRELASPDLIGMVVKRSDPEVLAWRAAVLERDGHQCTKCSSPDQLHAHHIVRWVDAPWLRIEPSNGATLCADCHIEVHSKHG